MIEYLVGLIVFVIGLYYMKFFKYYYYLRSIPGPFVYPIVGSGLEFKGGPYTMIDTFKRHRETYKTKTTRYMLGSTPMVNTSDYKMVEFILSNQKIITKSRTYKFLAAWLGEGLVTSTGEKWRKHRKILTPAFHFKILEEFVDIFDSNADVLLGKFSREVGKGSTDIYPFMTHFALDVICQTAMGTTINAQLDSESEYVTSVKEMCKIVIRRVMNPLLHFELLYRFTSLYQKQKKALTILHGYTSGIIKNRRKEMMEMEGNNNDDKEDFGIKKKKAFLDLMLQSTIDGRPLTDLELREETDTFMFGGHDTTGSAMSFCLYTFSMYPEVQQKCVEELRDIFGEDRARMATSEDMAQMKYLEMVIKETLRMYPSVPMLARTVTQEVEYGGVKFPPGLTLSCFVYALHHDADVYPDPEKFDPERFTPENLAGKSAYSFVPFSAGPRNCIGQKFAMLEMKSVLSKILRNFLIKPVVPHHELKLSCQSILSSTNGILVNIQKRDRF